MAVSYERPASAVRPWRRGRVPGVFGGNLGSNAGNLMYGATARRIIDGCAEVGAYRPWSPESLEVVKARHSHIVFAASNQLRLALNPPLEAANKVLADNIKKAGLPVVVLGLGLQAPLQRAAAVTPPPETLRLMHVLADHSVQIGVRGHATAEVFERAGISNVEVIGCPSCFWHRSPVFARTLTDPLENGGGPIAFNYTHPAKERALVQLAISNGFDLIAQSSEGRQLNETAEGSSTRWFERLFDGGVVQRDSYQSWIENHGYTFDSVEDWLDHMSRYSFSFGTRFHGNMVAMLAGITALWVVHDARTQELCEYLRLPSVTLEQAQAVTDPLDLFHYADYTAHKKAYPALYRRFYEFLEASGLQHNLPQPVPEHELQTS